MRHRTQLIAYADRFGGDMRGLRSLLDNELSGLFGGVHILPFFDPIDGADAGFDPKDHLSVDPRIGRWSDVAAIAEDHSVMADLIVNHVSADSPQFQDVRQRGAASPFWDLFLKKHDVFAETGPKAGDIARIYRPRPGQPFTPIRLDDGSAFDFWTTFSSQQLDINVEHPRGRAYLNSILERFADAGIREIRLDAAGYAIKRAGTSCFMLPQTFEFIAELSEQAGELGMEALVEVHSHYQTQIAIASSVVRVYDFALPPLILHLLYNADAAPLKRWLKIAPRNCVTVLDTHDGIGILDVARQGDAEGLLTDAAVDELVETIHAKTGDSSRRASGHAASNLDIYQVNSTYFDALGRSARDYLLARAIQFFAPGTPQVYYVGLLAGGNDVGLVGRSGIGRDINRHYYTHEEILAGIEKPVTADLLRLIRLRNSTNAFRGRFTLDECPDDRLTMRWNIGGDSAGDSASLTVDLEARRATIEIRQGGSTQTYVVDDRLRRGPDVAGGERGAGS